MNAKLYAIAKAQFAKSCPLVANAPPFAAIRGCAVDAQTRMIR